MDEKEIDTLLKRHMEAVHSLNMDSFIETLADDAEFIFLLSNNTVKGKKTYYHFSNRHCLIL